jgi:hypothetical protein
MCRSSRPGPKDLVRICELSKVKLHGGIQGFEILRITHCLDGWLTGGGKGVSLMHQPRSTLEAE